MNVYTMVVIIVVVTTLGGVAHRYLKLRERERKHQESRPDPAIDDRLAGIEKRLQVLEQIVTDSRYDLDRAFEDLEHDNGSGEQ
jgi:hypothetical protein